MYKDCTNSIMITTTPIKMTLGDISRTTTIDRLGKQYQQNQLKIQRNQQQQLVIKHH